MHILYIIHLCVIVCVCACCYQQLIRDWWIAWVHSTRVCPINTSGILRHRNSNPQSGNSHPPITSNPMKPNKRHNNSIKSHALQSVLRCAESCWVRGRQEGGTSATHAFSVRLWQAIGTLEAMADGWISLSKRPVFPVMEIPELQCTTSALPSSDFGILEMDMDVQCMVHFIWNSSNPWQMLWSSFLPSPFTTTWHWSFPGWYHWVGGRSKMT